MFNFTKLNDSEFSNLCTDILSGLGMPKPKEFPSEDIEKAYKSTIIRESNDGMFKTDESWLCIFIRSDTILQHKKIESIINAAVSADVRNLLVIVFGAVSTEADELLFGMLSDEDIRVVLLTDSLTEAIVIDYYKRDNLKTSKSQAIFSFDQVRKSGQVITKNEPWRQRFQTTGLQPIRLIPLHKEDSLLAESDLSRAMLNGSFLLLGEPGAGKTTSLKTLTENLSNSGPHTPVYLSLGLYEGDFINTLCDTISSKEKVVAKETAIKLLSSGMILLLLDGINEVQDNDLHERLINEINHFTNPQEVTSRSIWIVSGRVYDYEHSRHALSHLGFHRWEMQPLSEDLIYRFLADSLGENEAKSLFTEMGNDIRSVCENPLLLTMYFNVYEKTGNISIGRGALYHQFIELLLQWGSDRDLGKERLEKLDALFPETFDYEKYKETVFKVLSHLVDGMMTTMLPWDNAFKKFIDCLSFTHHPEQAAKLLLEDLTFRGVLKLDHSHRLCFFHHTFQEYFQARNMIDWDIDKIIPKKGIQRERYESVIFLAGLVPDPAPLLKRAIKIDQILAYQIVRNSTTSISNDLILLLAKKIWAKVLGPTKFLGELRRSGLLIKSLSFFMKKSIEELASQIDHNLTKVEQSKNLMSFYAQLGDAAGQQRILNQTLNGDDIPDELLFEAAISSNNSGDYQKAIDLYSHYIEKNPSQSPAYNNRANVYKKIGLKEKALADYHHAVKLTGNPIHTTNLATLLYSMEKKADALKHIKIALEKDPYFSLAHSVYSDWIEKDDPENALKHRELAVRYAPHDEDLRIFCRELSALQEKLGQYAGAIRTLRKMIALDPISTSVISWKKRIADLRQKLDAEERTRSARERLQEKGELPLPTLAFEWLKAIGLKSNSLTSSCFIAEGGAGLPKELPILLMQEPVITASGLRDIITSVPWQAKKSKQIVVITISETLSIDARHQLSALQDEYRIILLTALEIRDALLQSDSECRLLLDRALNRMAHETNPFQYKGIVREHTEFFGRISEFEKLTNLLAQKQQIGLYGIHKIGKSSLLEQLRRKLHISHPEITILKVELDTSIETESSFYREVVEKIPSATDNSLLKNITSTSFKQALFNFHKRCQKKHLNHHLLLVIDEYAFLIPDRKGKGGIDGYIKILGVLKSIHQEGWFSILPCGRTATLNRQASFGEQENPFIDLLHPFFLGPLSREETNTLMKTLGRRAKLNFDQESLDIVFDETGGHPTFCRSIGSMILGQGDGKVTKARVMDAIDKVLNDYDKSAIIRAIYHDRLDKDEQEIARILALKGALTQKELLRTSDDITHRRQILAAIANLIDTSVLIKHSDGKIEHRYGLLYRFIKEEAQELGYE